MTSRRIDPYAAACARPRPAPSPTELTAEPAPVATGKASAPAVSTGAIVIRPERLSPDTLLNQTALGRALRRGGKSIRRLVDDGHLPEPKGLGKDNIWRWGDVVECLWAALGLRLEHFGKNAAPDGGAQQDHGNEGSG